LLGDDFPIEVSTEFHVALLHWLDSLAGLQGVGLTGGKTVDAHRFEYGRLLGKPSARDEAVLRGFAAARQRAANRQRAVAGRIAPPADAVALAFFEAGSTAEALVTTGTLLDPRSAGEIATAVNHFAPRYEVIWRDGRVPRGFVGRVDSDPRRAALADFLVGVAAFFGVSPRQVPAPRVHLMPVIDGFGTHAQAIENHLLIEVRDGEGLLDEIPPIVHENAHLLFHRMDPERLRRFARRVAHLGPEGAAAWRSLLEALPTAIAQGVAGERFETPGWSVRQHWYHTATVDRHAKRIFRLVRQALDEGSSFDEEFLERALAAYPGTRRE